MDVVFMGTGTSQGVPMIAHEAEGLDLKDRRNWRSRCSIHVEMAGQHYQVDAAQEFRLQCLQNQIRWIDRFILTHGHADHILGMDDLRRFCDLRGWNALPVYSTPQGLQRIREIYPYAIGERPLMKGYPAFQLNEMPRELEVTGGSIASTLLPHGQVEVLGLIFKEAATGKRIGYFTDCKCINEAQREQVRGADVVILDALRPHPHPTHMSVDEALEAAASIGAGRTYFTHMTAYLDHETWQSRMPEGIFLAYDGLRVTV